MARTAVPYTSLAVNSSVTQPSGTAITSGAGNGGQIAKAEPEKTVLRVVCGATGGNLTVLKGNYPPAMAASQGDLTQAFTANEVRTVGPIESGRFLQNDGSLIFECTQNMTVTAYKVAR